jgi:hypothetical protein
MSFNNHTNFRPDRLPPRPAPGKPGEGAALTRCGGDDTCLPGR